jgi:hypothetical protein
LSTDIQTLARAHAHASFLASGGVVNVSSASELESKGWRVWLTTLFPFAFDEEFSEDHCKFWDLYWSVLLRIREHLKYQKLSLPIPVEYAIEPKETVILYILGRGLGKSASVEPSAVMRGAILKGGYSLFISESDDQAQEHLGNTRILIEHPDSRLTDYYPDMAITDDPLQGLPAIDRRELFVTRCGWIARAKGLKAKMRGLRIGTRRPDDLNIDDVDDVNDSIALSVSKRKTLTSSILPVLAKELSTVKFTQNLISEHSVMNQIHTGQSDALSVRTTIGPTKTFTKFDYQTYLDDEDGLTKHKILSTSVPSWKGVDISRAQNFLNNSGLFDFFAEYQNEFDQNKAEKVLRNWDDSVHVITESEFAGVYGTKDIPDRWYKYGGNDWSDTKSAYHANVAGFVTVSSQNEPLPGMTFAFSPMSFEAGTEADEVAMRMIKTISPKAIVNKRQMDWDTLLEDTISRANLERYFTNTTKLIDEKRKVLTRVIPQYVQQILQQKNYRGFKGSHEEENNALKVYRDIYGLPFKGVNPGKKGGLELLNHLMQVDYDAGHPFKKGQKGFSRFFLIVPDNKAPMPKALQPDALHDHDLFRYQVSHWRNVPIKLTNLGVIEHGTQKMNDDFGNWLQFMFFEGMPQAAPLSQRETLVAAEPALGDLDKQIQATGGLKQQDELKYHVLQAMAKKKIGSGGVRRFSEDGELLRED